jgi:hypothetical protein
MEQPIEPKKSIDPLEVSVRKPKKRSKKADKIKFNLTFVEKDVQIFFK